MYALRQKLADFEVYWFMHWFALRQDRKTMLIAGYAQACLVHVCMCVNFADAKTET